jgi:uncharacterized OsmC-like protein
MAHKTVTVNTELGSGTKIECKAGNHVFLIDQPKSGGGNDLGPTPLEYYLASLAGCVSSIAQIVARQKKIDLRSLKITTVGDLNVDVLLGKNTEERAGFQSIALQVDIDADLSDSQKVEFINEVERRCPVSENTLHASNVTIAVTR